MNDSSCAQRTPRPATARSWGSLAILVLAVTLLAVDGTVLALAIPSLATDLGATSTQVLWIGDVYSLMLAGLLITMGNVADRIGRKRLLLIGATAFGIASLLGAFAPTPEVLIAARAALGIAGATLMPSTLSLIRVIFEVPAQRTMAIGLWAAGASAGAALGPLVGGVLLEHFWWGSVFLINIPVMLVLLAVGIPLLPESRHPNPGKLDLIGVVLSIVAGVSVVWAIKTVAKDGLTLGFGLTLVVGIAALMLFVRRQRSREVPLLDVSLFRSKSFSGAIIAAFVSIFAMSGLVFFFSQYLQLVEGHSPLQAGVRQLPMSIAMLLVPAVAGRIAARNGQKLGVGIASGLFVAAIGLIAIAWAESSSSYVWIAVGLVAVGFGIGLAYTLTTDAVVGAVPAERAGAASAITETAYEFGIAVGIAVMGSIQAAVYRNRLQELTIPANIDEPVRDSLASAVPVLVDQPELLAAAREAFVSGMQINLCVGAALLIAVGLMALRLIQANELNRAA